MKHLAPDPLGDGGIIEFASRLRHGRISAEGATEAYLGRIRALDGALGAYEYVAWDDALHQARAVDGLLRSRTDLGPLMGVPVAIKDIFAVDGMPTTAGSNLDVTDIIGSEGTFVRRLKQAGCIILGKLKTVEFALGGSGVNFKRGTPRNPWDADVFRVAAGSSSGAGVAVAAGLCGFAIGSDTGGSVRGPAAFCGVVGVKATAGLWPADGVFQLSKTFDSIGPLTRSATDAAIVVAALLGNPVAKPISLRGLRLGKPSTFFDDGDDRVLGCIDSALADLVKAGAEIVEVDIREASEISESSPLYATICRPELISYLGRQRFLATRDEMNPDVADRASAGLSVPADDYISALSRHRELRLSASNTIAEVDAWVAPAKWRLAPAFPGEWKGADADRELDRLCAGPTRAVNLLGLCAVSQPVQQYGAALPVGMQIICPSFEEQRLLSIARAIEQVIGAPRMPHLGGFLSEK